MNRMPGTMSTRLPNFSAAGKTLKVLFCGLEFQSGFERVRDFLKQESSILLDRYPRKEIQDKISDYHFIVPCMMKLDSETLSRAKEAAIICQFGVGLEGVDIESATKLGIKVARISASSNRLNAVSCAEHCIYLILGLLRKQNLMAEAVANQVLGSPEGITLWGKTVLIVGFGAIGEELSLRLKPFSVKILGIRRSWDKASNSASAGVDERGGPEDLLPFVNRADIIVMCSTLTNETRGMVNSEFYGAMKKGTLLVNIARGGLLDYQATRDALESGQLGGLGMDVAWTEPTDPTDFVASHSRTIVTPHIGGVTDMSYAKMAHVLSETIRQVRDGEDVSLVETVN